MVQQKEMRQKVQRKKGKENQAGPLSALEAGRWRAEWGCENRGYSPLLGLLISRPAVCLLLA